jgi:predicted aminopeptidase
MKVTRTQSRPRWTLRVALATLATLGCSTFIPGCGVGYVVRSAYFQAELLHSREPIAKAKARRTFNAKQLASFDRIADIKGFGKTIGLKATDNYETYAGDWNRTIWNLTACPDLSFSPVTWRFPIVGKVPYLGFFRRSDADAWARRLGNDGNEVYLRTAGAYSTLGWFRDPILPGMLEWDEYQLANTVLHELAHATLWIEGSVKFNESFANFVGRVAAIAYLEDRFGADSAMVIRTHENLQDLRQWRLLLRSLYEDLDRVYKDDMLSDVEKRAGRATLYGALSERVQQTDLIHSDRFERAVEKGPWNNARLSQYRTYNHRLEQFESVLNTADGDLLQFIQLIEEITTDQEKPFAALEAAARL